jgi:hypothetical protein
MIQWEPGMSLDDVARETIEQALKFHGGNKTATAKALGISRNTIDNKFEEWKKTDEQRLAFEAREKDRSDSFAKGGAIHPDAVPIGGNQSRFNVNGKKPLTSKKK